MRLWTCSGCRCVRPPRHSKTATDRPDNSWSELRWRFPTLAFDILSTLCSFDGLRCCRPRCARINAQAMIAAFARLWLGRPTAANAATSARLVYCDGCNKYQAPVEPNVEADAMPVRRCVCEPEPIYRRGALPTHGLTGISPTMTRRDVASWNRVR